MLVSDKRDTERVKTGKPTHKLIEQESFKKREKKEISEERNSNCTVIDFA